MSFGENLKKARKDAGLTQIELARRAGITERSIYNYEYNDRVPRISTVAKLAQILGVSSDWLLGGQEGRGEFLHAARDQFGPRGEAEAREILERTSALFAGGELDQDAKDAFFESITQAYFLAKNRAREKYGRGGGGEGGSHA